MNAFLFSYELFGVKRYTLVHAEKVEEAYGKLDRILNPTGKTIEIEIATILPDMYVETK